VVARVVALSDQYATELATLAAITPATQQKLAVEPTNEAAARAAVAEIATNLRITPAEAQARLAALGQVPRGDLLLLQSSGAKVQSAASALASLSKIPPSDVAYLSANASDVAEAKADNPGQWQTWWWVCFAGQIVFLPFVFLLTGRWNPRKAREDEIAHERMVERELAALASAGGND
jgi:ACS family D-galactonate transporter-like MFS transporter